MSTATPPNKKPSNNRRLESIAGRLAVSTSPQVPVSSNESQSAPSQRSAIQERAYRLWQSRGCPLGDDKQDWFTAERELAVLSRPPKG